MKIFVFLALLSSTLYPPYQSDFAEKYLEANRQTMHGQSSAEDVQRLLSMYTDDIIYEHPKAGFKLETKAVIEKGRMSFLKSYGGTAADVKTRLISHISNDNTQILEFEIEFLTNENKKVKRTQIQVLELSDQKIKRIIDYW